MSRRLRILLVTDALTPPARGNGTTVGRWMEGLLERGHEVEVADPRAGAEAGRCRAPDVVHGYHARRAGPAARRLAARLGCPLVLSLGGTDLLDLETTPAAATREVVAALEASQCVTGAFASFADRLAAAGGPPPERYRVVRRGVEVDPDVGGRPRDGARLEIVLPAGLRPVKDPLLGVRLAVRLVEAGLPLRLRLLGAALDPAQAAAVHAAAAPHPWIEIGRRSPLGMAAAYLTAHVVWNTSHHEGGANAVLEGLALGCQAWLRNVDGNREYVQEGGGEAAPLTLFDAEDDERLVGWHVAAWRESDAQRAARWQRTRAWLGRFHDPADELDELERAYVEAASSTQTGA